MRHFVDEAGRSVSNASPKSAFLVKMDDLLDTHARGAYRLIAIKRRILQNKNDYPRGVQLRNVLTQKLFRPKIYASVIARVNIFGGRVSSARTVPQKCGGNHTGTFLYFTCVRREWDCSSSCSSNIFQAQQWDSHAKMFRTTKGHEYRSMCHSPGTKYRESIRSVWSKTWDYL